jgi:hypothetical protein
MDKSFVERFAIDTTTADARARFVNRVRNEIYRAQLKPLSNNEQWAVGRHVATKLGIEHTGYTDTMVGREFLDNVAAIEAIYDAVSTYDQRQLSARVQQLLTMAETDLGVTWRDGRFYPSGAKLLDEALANDPLRWLRAAGHQTVVTPFEKGLRHLVDAPKRPELTTDVVTDMYEALEALAKIVTGRPEKDLSANRELFLARVKASEEYKRIMREYIEYANNFRHAATKAPKPHVSLAEAESFTYLTGLFLRLAMSS